MLRNTAIFALFAVSTSGLVILTTASSCTITTVNGEGEGEGEGGEGEGGEGEGGEGEGEGGAGEKSGACVAAGNCCSDGIDNDGNNFTDCDDFACAGDPACNVGSKSIQSFMDPNGGTALNAGVTIDHAIVTGTHIPAGGNVDIYIQAAQGDTGGIATDVYPTFAGTEVFIPTAVAGTITGLSATAVGDCITTSGTVDLFHDQVQFKASSFAQATGCGGAPTASVKTIDTINDTGADSKKFLDTVVEIDNVDCDLASSGGQGSFEVKDGNNNTIFVSGFLLATKPVKAVGDHFTSITGILTQFDVVDQTTNQVTATHFDITPRTDADLVP